jgi:hypothetical protein
METTVLYMELSYYSYRTNNSIDQNRLLLKTKHIVLLSESKLFYENIFYHSRALSVENCVPLKSVFGSVRDVVLRHYPSCADSVNLVCSFQVILLQFMFPMVHFPQEVHLCQQITVIKAKVYIRHFISLCSIQTQTKISLQEIDIYMTK